MPPAAMKSLPQSKPQSCDSHVLSLVPGKEGTDSASGRSYSCILRVAAGREARQCNSNSLLPVSQKRGVCSTTVFVVAFHARVVGEDLKVWSTA